MIRTALHESLDDKRRDYNEALKRLHAEAARLTARLDVIYVDKVDGLIDEESYRRMSEQWREERDRCHRDMERYNEADDSYIDSGVALIRLTREAHRVFETQPAGEKRRLLNFLLSNCIWANGELRADFNEPFDLLAETVADAARHSAAEGPESAQNEKWLPGPDSNRRPSD
jgi:site-specific DNA recombinase